MGGATEDRLSTAALRTTTRHFWMSAGPFFKTRCLVAPSGPSFGVTPVRFLIYDPDGELINEVVVSFEQDSVGTVDFEQFLAGCKTESGLVHAHIVTQSTCEVDYRFVIEQGKLPIPLGEPILCNERRPAYLPYGATKETQTLMALVNCESFPLRVLIRLHYLAQELETVRTVPAYGARLVSVLSEFHHLRFRGDSLGYLEVRPFGKAGNLGVQLLEESVGPLGRKTFRSVT